MQRPRSERFPQSSASSWNSSSSFISSPKSPSSSSSNSFTATSPRAASSSPNASFPHHSSFSAFSPHQSGTSSPGYANNSSSSINGSGFGNSNGNGGLNASFRRQSILLNNGSINSSFVASGTSNSGVESAEKDHTLDGLHATNSPIGRWRALVSVVPYIAAMRKLDLPLDSHPIAVLTALQTILLAEPRKRFLLDECRRLPIFNNSMEARQYLAYLGSVQALFAFQPWKALQKNTRVTRLVPRCGLMNPKPKIPCALIFVIQLYCTDLEFREAIVRFTPPQPVFGEIVFQESSPAKPVLFTMHLRLLFVQMLMSNGRALDPSHVLQMFRDAKTGKVIETSGTDLSSFDEYERMLLMRVHDQMDPYIRGMFVSNNPLYRPENIAVRSKLPLRHVRADIDVLVARDPLYELTIEDRKLLWENRYYIARHAPKALPKFLIAVDFSSQFQIQEAYRLLHAWPQGAPVTALALMDFKYVNPQIRALAVDRLDAFSNPELVDFLPQLTQILKFEPHFESALARFFVRRASEDLRLGQYFFWFLKSQIHEGESMLVRYQKILDNFLCQCSEDLLKEFANQESLVKDLVRIAELVKDFPLKDRKSVLHEELAKLKFPPRMKIPLSPDIEICGLRIPKCKTMDSKKVPLWLVFERANDIGGEPYVVIFKSGDDLRQDLLTLQMFRIMDRLWKSHGLDMRMLPYGCVATGDQIGFIEVVLDSDTCANITSSIGGGAKGAYDKTTFEKWLRKANPTFDSYCRAVQYFASSCAAYCVGTYVLGIGDRHNDNIMMQRSGKLFHIDFGHFLGNVKYKFGFKRERAPFVFTPDMAYVMGGEGSTSYNDFVDLCCESYNVLRKYSDLFLILFILMLSTGLPELQSKDDIEYLREALQIGATERQASDYFKKLIRESLHSKATQFNFYIHIWKHSH
eukprot:ANDGO_03641.mRNA.1 Phosphatidylinositol 3-kinase 2